MSLLDCFLDIIKEWKTVFPKFPSHKRASYLALASLCTFGRACISRFICFLGFEQQDWSAYYKLFSRSHWNTRNLFIPILRKATSYVNEDYIAVAFDDTKLKKTGKKIKTAFYQKDPMSPPFYVNLMFGLRFLQGSLLIPMYHKNNQPPRALPIVFKEVPAVKKPGKKATEEEKKRYKEEIKTINLSTYFVKSLKEVREDLDQVGAKDKDLISVVDGSFCNRICMRTEIERTSLVARGRKDAKLCFRSTRGGRKIYDDNKFTPEEIRKDLTIPWQTTSIFHGGKWREVRFKEVNNVLWERGTKDRPLKLIVIAPTPYRLTKKGKLYYRKAAYLLCQSTTIATEILIQKYFDRWQIEVNHREEKDTLGVGQAQVRSNRSVPRQPAFVVAAYSALLLASIYCFEDKRTNVFIALPKWRRNAKRPSCLDLIHLLRKELSLRKANGIEIDLALSALKSAA
jgi:hypothetical protein